MSGETADHGELRWDTTLNLQGDPVCWEWPVPAGITFANAGAAEEFLAWWNRSCAICGADTTLVKDHDHKTMLVRGFLCPNCNSQEGWARGESDVYSRYRSRCPAAMLGMEVRYQCRPVPRTLRPSAGVRPAPKTRASTMGRRIREFRTACGMSQGQLAAGMRERGYRWHGQTVTRVEWGKQCIEYSEFFAIADTLGVAYNDLAGYDITVPRSPTTS